MTRIRLGLVWFWFSQLVSSHAFETRYWVWHRSTPVSPAEQTALREQGVQELLWHAGTLRSDGSRWALADQLSWPKPAPLGFGVTPVLRLATEAKPALSTEAAFALSQLLRAVANQVGSRSIQLDYDCPDRLLPAYADLLARCRAEIAPLRLTITALAGWSEHQAFPQLQSSVDAIYPMFYDLRPDAPTEVRQGKVLPILDAEIFEKQAKAWAKCRIPWHAGLPGFARVTIFRADGVSRGHLRHWDWDVLAFNPSLLLQTRVGRGVTLLRAEQGTVVGDTQLQTGETAACRWPERAALAEALQIAQKAGAAGGAIFRLPEGGASGGWSLRQWAEIWAGQPPSPPVLTLGEDGPGLILWNEGGNDLPPRLAGAAGPRDRGWSLEIDGSGVAAFREASPGDFAAAFGHIHPNAPEPVKVRIEMAERLTFWFANLPAGAARRTGLLQLAPGTSTAALRWRVPGLTADDSWHSLARSEPFVRMEGK